MQKVSVALLSLNRMHSTYGLPDLYEVAHESYEGFGQFFLDQLTSAAYTASEPSDILSAPALKYLEATSTAEYVCQHEKLHPITIKNTRSRKMYSRWREGTTGPEKWHSRSRKGTVGREKVHRRSRKMAP